MYAPKNAAWAAVIHTLFTRLTRNPCKKYPPGAFWLIRHAQKIKMTSQKKGSMPEGIQEIVANAIASPKRES